MLYLFILYHALDSLQPSYPILQGVIVTPKDYHPKKSQFILTKGFLEDLHDLFYIHLIPFTYLVDPYVSVE